MEQQFVLWDNDRKEQVMVVAKKKGKEWNARCPFHNDGANPNLFINAEKETYYCHSCQKGGLLFKELSKEKSMTKISKVYTYHNADGSEAYEIVRMIPKSFRIRHKDEKGNYVWNQKGVTIVPYRLPELIDAIKAGKNIIITEGEKDADNLANLGFQATTNPFGAAKWRPEFNAYFAGVKVILCEDHDNAGHERVQRIGKELTGIAESIRVVSHRDMPEHSDITDFVNTGKTRDDLIALFKTAKPFVPDPEPEPTSEPMTINTESPERFFNYNNKFVPVWLAREIAIRHVLCFGYDKEKGAGCLMEYKDGVWRPAVGLDWDAHMLLGDRVSQFRIRETIGTLEREVTKIPWTDFNKNRDLINCKSGMLDPVTGKIEKHDPQYYSTFQVPVEYDPSVSCEIVDTFLKGVLPVDAIELAKQMMGYILIPTLISDKFFILEGAAGTGKTTFLDAFLGMLGDENWTQVTLQDLAENRFSPAKLENKLLGCYDDLDSIPLRTASEIKALTGGFPWIDVERKCRDGYKAPLYARLLFTCNEIPTAPDRSNAWYDRLLIISFPNVFRNTPKDIKDLPEKMATVEAQQRLFALAVSGLQMLAENKWHFSEPVSSKTEINEYELMNDSVKAFVKDCCIIGTDKKAGRTQIKHQYELYCHSSGIVPGTRNALYKYIRDGLGCGDGKDDKGCRQFSGIGIQYDDLFEKSKNE